MTQPQPIVLVGGGSVRFGRDKLREPIGGGRWLVDRAIAAQREATHAPVTLVGPCDPEIAARGDRHIDDAHPGAGPAGGVLTALESMGDVIVLSGDLPWIRAESVTALLAACASAEGSRASVVRAESEPLIAVYRASSTARLAERLARGCFSLWDLAEPPELVEVRLPAHDAVNANTEEALRGIAGVWAFEGIDHRLDLVPIAARRALDRAGVHLSLDGWRALELADREALVEHGRIAEVDSAAVRAVAGRAGTAARSIDVEPEDPSVPELLRSVPSVVAAWPALDPLERFALGHAARSAQRRDDPTRLERAIEAVVRRRPADESEA